MKVKKLKLDNFTKFVKFEVDFDGNVTRLIGVNGSGKTTIGLTAIWAALKGISEKSKDGALVGERFRFIGNGKATADVELTLIDEKKGNVEIIVKNRISKDSNSITFEAPKNYPVNNAWLNSLLSVAFLSAKNFSQLSPKEQAVELGIDVSNFDREMKELKEEFTTINRQIRVQGELSPVEPVETVDLKELLAAKEEIEFFNAAQETAKLKIQRVDDKIADYREQELKLLEELENIRGKIAEGKKYKAELPQPEELKDVSELSQKIASASELNEMSMAYKTYIEKKAEREKLVAELNTNKEAQDKLANQRLEFIKDFNFGVDGLSVDEDGGLELNGKPLRDPYFSKGEMEVIVARLHARQNPELKLRFVDDFELLDNANKKQVLDLLTEAGFQVITAEVGEQAKGDNVVLLRECKIVEAE